MSDSHLFSRLEKLCQMQAGIQGSDGQMAKGKRSHTNKGEAKLSNRETCEEHEVHFPNFKAYLWHVKEIHQNATPEELEKIHEY